jgi:TP901-1 family phage major tail protein
VLPDFGEITGLFQITSLDYRGEHAGEVTFDLAMESAGPITFEAL